MSTGRLTCANCGTQLRENARFCDGCGSSVSAQSYPAEYKQVTVLFADVVRSMDLAAALDPERLREIMSAVFNRSAVVVQRYGGTVDKFTGDGIMALFGAPVALEDHAVRACLAALDIQSTVRRIADEVEASDGVSLRVRIGLNSGEVIAGEIDSGPGGYTVVGQQVGLAQRMESVAPPGGVMLSESTAALVEEVLALEEPELVYIKGAIHPLPARRLIVTGAGRVVVGRQDPTLVGRDWEISTVTAILERAVAGRGCVVGVSGPPGIGKSRMVHEIAKVAKGRGIATFTVYCESHASEIPFHTVSQLLRNVFGVDELSNEVARARVRAILPEVGPEDLALFDDLLGIREIDGELPEVNADTRQRRLAQLVKTASLARITPALYIIEDAHWIDEVSDAMIADFVSVVPQARAMVLVTYRPEYVGALTRKPNALRLSLAPLNVAESSVFTTELIGADPSVAALSELITERAAGNPFFAQEIVRDLAERGVLDGEPRAFTCRSDTRDVRVPVTVQATIAARIDRLDTASKRNLLAASVLGARFSATLLADVLGDTVPDAGALAKLVDAELLDQVIFSPGAEYAFRHPMMRTVAYESQLKSDRADLHRRLAARIERRAPAAADENAALIAEHLEAAGDMESAFHWHMRAGTWSQYRDITAAKISWQRARDVADRISADDPNQLAMRIAPRTLLKANAWRIGGDANEASFTELRDLTGLAGDKFSLAIAMAGHLAALTFNDHITESAELATECAALLESIGETVLTVAMLAGPMQAKCQAGKVHETLRLADRVVSLADGDATVGNLAVGSPLAFALAYRGRAQMFLGQPGFCDQFDMALAMSRLLDATTYASVAMLKYMSIFNRAVAADDTAEADTAHALIVAEQSGDGFAVGSAMLARGTVLVDRDGPASNTGYELLAKVRDLSGPHRVSQTAAHFVEIQFARRKAQTGDIEGAVELARTTTEKLLASGDRLWLGAATTTLVEALLQRGANSDLAEVASAIARLERIPVDPGFVLNEIPLLRMRALLAWTRGEENGYRRYADRYRTRATECGLVGHIVLAEAMV